MKTNISTSIALALFSLSVGCGEPEVCTDGIDNDGNGLVDCEDQAVCGVEPSCQEGGNCEDGIDNDLDGLQDCESPACASTPECSDATFAACFFGTPFVQPTSESLGNSGAGSNLLAGSCTGSGGAPEFVFRTGSGAATVVDIFLFPDPNESADLGLYVRSDCTDEDSELGCADELGAGGAEVLRNIPIGASDSITIVVDGASADEVGAFTLSIIEK
jgi:hypothetical protein